jgi:beta-phosphoglucomutase
MECLDIMLERSSRAYAQEERTLLADRKNGIYVDMLSSLSPADILPGISEFLSELEKAGIQRAICSASRNADLIVAKLGIRDRFDAVVTGNDTTVSKPHPQGFLLAAERLDISPVSCLVIEDAFAGIEAAVAAGMKSMGIGYKTSLYNADCALASTRYLTLERARMLY